MMDVDGTIAALDRGEVRVAEKVDGDWRVNEDAKAAILEYFRVRKVEPIEVGALSWSRCILTACVLIGEGAVLAPNAPLTGSVPVIDVTGPEPVEHRGYVPPRAVVLPITRPKEFPAGTYDVACALVVGWRC